MEFNKRQTVNFTTEGHAQLKELTKRHGVNQYMMLDALIKTVDEENEAFLVSVEDHKRAKEAKKAVSREAAAALTQVTQGMTTEEIVALIEKAKQL